MPFRSARLCSFVPWVLLAAAACVVSAHAQAEPPTVLDPAIRIALAQARTAQGVAAYVALRQLWKRWDQTDPNQVQEALRVVERDTTLAAPVRAYAGMLEAYGRRRRGDLDGAKRKIRDLGLVTHWLTVGPFDNEGKASLYTPFGPEEDLRKPLTVGSHYEGKERPVAWRLLPDAFGYGWLDFNAFVRPSEKVCAYASAFVRAKDKRQTSASATLWVGASGAWRAFWDAEEVLADTAYRALDADRWATRIQVKPGWNRLTIKACGDEQGPMLQVRVGDEQGAPSDLWEISSDPANAQEAAKNSSAASKQGTTPQPSAPRDSARLAEPSSEEKPIINPTPQNSPPPSGVGRGADQRRVHTDLGSGPNSGPRLTDPSVTPKIQGQDSAKGTEGTIRIIPQKAPPADMQQAQRHLPPATGGALRDLNRVALGQGGSAEQLEMFSRYLSLTGGDDPSQHIARNLAYRAAESAPTPARLLLAGELAEDHNTRATWIARARARIKPGDDDTDVTLAEAFHARNAMSPREAVPFLEKILARDPNHIAALLGRVELYSEAGLKYAALSTLEDAVRRVPHSVALLRALANQYRIVGRTTDAEETEERYAELRFDDPTFMRSHIELAVARRDMAMATHWIERLLDTDPDSSVAFDFAARSFHSLGDSSRAMATLQRRLDLAPEDVETLRALADIYGEDGQSEEQLKLLRQILVLRPQAKDIREYVENVQPPKVRRDEAYAWDQEQIAALARAPAPKGFPKRTLRDLQVTTAYTNGLASRFHQVVFQPLSEEGAAAARQYAFAFEAGREIVEVRAARVYRTNGKIDEAIETGQGPADSPELAMYTSTRTFYVHLPRLSAGDIVELRYRVEEITPRNEFGDRFSETTYLQSLEPIASSEYVLLAPRGRKVLTQWPALRAFTHQESDEGDAHVLRVIGQDIAPIAPEPLMPPLPEVAAGVSVSTFTSWDDVGRWFWGLAKDQFDVDEDVRRRVADITKGLTTDEAKVRAVYDYVVQRTRYVALEFGLEGFRPRRCAQTLGRGWGDCKDKATVLVTMLRELGIPANLVLVRTGMRGQAPAEPPSYAFFDHAIAYIPKFDLYLDGTAEYTGMGELPTMDRGAIGLHVLEGGKVKLARLPEAAADQTHRARTIDATLSETGPAALDLHIENTGALAAEWRQRYHALATQRSRLVEDLSGDFGGLTLNPGAQGLEVNNLENIEDPVQVHIRGKALGLAKNAAGEISFRPAPLGNLVPRLAPLSERVYDLQLPVSSTYADQWDLHIPATMQVKHIPDSKHVESLFGRLALEVENSAGKVTIKVNLRFDRTRIHPSEYKVFRAFCEEVDRALSERVVIAK